MMLIYWEESYIKKNAEALVVASKETRLEVNADNSKYMVMYRDQNAGQSHNIQIDNSSFERVEEFKYLATTLTLCRSNLKLYCVGRKAAFFSVGI